MRIPDSQLYTGQDHPSSGMGGIIQIGWLMCTWLMKPVMFYHLSFIQLSFIASMFLVFCCLYTREMKEWIFLVAFKPIVVIAECMFCFTTCYFSSQMILTCVHISEKRIRFLSKDKKKIQKHFCLFLFLLLRSIDSTEFLQIWI